MSTISLDNRQKSEVLAHLGVPEMAATLPFLEQLLAAYYCTIPWESAFRIVRRAETNTPSPRWPEQFWHEALTQGSGGTCFESNYAFFALLQSLGFAGYLTINNMGESIGCHTAIMILLEGQKWLVDAGLPLYAVLPIKSQEVVQRSSPFLDYTVRPDGRFHYQIERSPHPKPNAFTLIDEPVDDAAYRAATTADYGENGLFLDTVIVNKIINNQPWRFNMAERPWRLNRFDWGRRIDYEMAGDAATAVAEHFGLETAVVQKAFHIIAARAEKRP